MKKILVVVDYQNEFVNGKLAVDGADKIYENIQKQIASKKYEKIIYTFDTHTKKEYNTSSEKLLFPQIHCKYKTKGWYLYNIKPNNYEEFDSFVEKSIKPFGSYFIKNEAFFTKNIFDIWEGNETYENYIKTNYPKDEYEFVVCGVATNYCVFLHVMGLVKRDYKVTLLKDCIKGIKVLPNGSEDSSYEENYKIMKNSNVKIKNS